MTDTNISPRGTLTVLDGVVIMVGMVVGAGIFKTPALVADNCGSVEAVFLLWLAGGVFSLVGALCYAELTSAYPHPGGDYHYLSRTFGRIPSFLFAWSRMTVIQTGSIAMLAFLAGDYATEVMSLGTYSSSLYAAGAVVLLTAVNVVGIHQGRWTQIVLTTAIVLGLLSVVGFGLFATEARLVEETVNKTTTASGVGMALIFVLLTYGGWNEVAYLSSEVTRARKNMVRVLVYGIAAVTAIYLAVNYVFLVSLGLEGTAASKAVAVDVMRRALGASGASYITLLVIVAVLSTLNAVIITGSRTKYAFGRDFTLFAFLGRWNRRANTPINALLLQSGIALVLIAVGTGTRGGFTTMVEYTAPVFWFFFFLVGVSLFVLRWKEKTVARPFRVPLYPFTPLLFCSVCLYMLYSSLAYTGKGGIVGVVVLLAGLPLLFFAKPAVKGNSMQD